ncbi:MAG: DUF3791 domain-containing protein [Neisseriaceae bacterium]|nr:DUF3791 domain-containing protein [Neisseriaceae bacterium]
MMSKEMEFFIFLIERYSYYKNKSAGEILKLLDEKKLTDFIYQMYEMYHIERIENAFDDIDSLIATGKTAW